MGTSLILYEDERVDYWFPKYSWQVIQQGGGFFSLVSPFIALNFVLLQDNLFQGFF